MQSSSDPSNPTSPQRAHEPEPDRFLRAGSSADYQLAHLAGERPDAPTWAREALACEPEQTFVDVEGAAIEVLSWGQKDLPSILFLHGSRASADWWTVIAPLLMRDYRVVALSFSGMGRSERRNQYSISHFAREALAVAEAQNLFRKGQKPLFLAHSFGGYPALRAGSIAAGRIAGLILIDTIIEDFALLGRTWRLMQPERVRTYATVAQALSRFRLIPHRATESLWALDEIARRSLRQIPETGEWTWQFDNALFANLMQENLPDLLTSDTPVAVVRGEFSELYAPDTRDQVAALFGTDIPDIVIPQAGHHVMIDQPLALVAALRALLGSWPARPGVDRRSRLGS